MDARLTRITPAQGFCRPSGNFIWLLQPFFDVDIGGLGVCYEHADMAWVVGDLYHALLLAAWACSSKSRHCPSPRSPVLCHPQRFPVFTQFCVSVFHRHWHPLAWGRHQRLWQYHISLWQCLHSRTSDNAVRLAPAVDTSGERVQDDCGTDFHLHENTQCEMRSLFDVLDEPWAKLKRQITYMML